ncbi:OmpA family protein [Nesterenkonia muleiensis]|uniref:OmpA family protein n=1 Tax=Nesterenkonia muleiensis TaxID=2282648 RepID=UPI000E73FCF1|nr:OmpA family protein [Nesterenkonia muleiensis]
MLAAEVDKPVEFEECEEATVTWLDDVVIEEEEVPGVEAETAEIDGETVWSETPWSESLEGGDSTPTMSLHTYSSDTMRIDTVRVDTERLDTYRLEGIEHTERSGEDESVSCTTEGDVLFGSLEFELRSHAEAELEVTADEIAERDDDFIIKVEGHTDDVPVDPDQDFSDNDELSELRAESVAQWLIDNAGVEEDIITAEGLGEDYPRADNDTDEGRQLNRRVVITVQPEDYESSLDYELEEGEGEG